MMWKIRFSLALLSLCCLASLQWTSAAVTSATEPAESEVEEVLETGSVEKWEYPRPCFVEKSKVEELIVQMNSTVRILSRGDGNLQCQEKLRVETFVVEEEDIEICSEERIQRIQKDLFKVAGSLFQAAIRLTEPSEDEVHFLHLIKFQLVEDLRVLRVFYGSLSCDSYSIALFPFQRLVKPVEESLDQIYLLFKSARSTRLPPPTTATTTRKPTINDMLNPEKSFSELIELAEANPSLMSRALPKIVSQRYSRRVSTFDSLLEFVNAMPTTENKIFGFSAVYDEMHGHNQKPEELQLMKLAKSLAIINASALTTLNAAARSKLDELIPDLRPLIFVLSPEKSLQELTEWVKSNPSLMSTALPEIISERYNASDFQFDALLNFVEGLPTTENKINGYAAVHDEILRHNQTTNLAQLLKLTKKVKTLNEDDQTTSTLANTATALKWTNLICELSSLMLVGEKANCNVTNVAYGTQLLAGDWGWPWSAYVFQDQSSKRMWQIYAAVQNDKLVFRLGGGTLFFASDTKTNTDSRDTIYQTKTSERYVLKDAPSLLPTNAEIDWKIVAVPNKVNHFRILSAKYDDFWFAHKSETGIHGYRRVLLGKQSYIDHDHIPNAGLWTLDCEPGTFEIPSI